jgi:tetratricopeptide (TPR) repeat protein
MIGRDADAFDFWKRKEGLVDQGNAALKAGKPKDAIAAYDQAAKRIGDPAALAGIALARGTALATQDPAGQYDAAKEALVRASGAEDPAVRARAFYNLGTLHLGQKKYKDAIAALTGALRLRPDDRDAKWNLEVALRELEKEEEQKKKDEEKKKKEQKKKDEKKDEKPEPKKDEKPEPKKDEPKKDEPKKDEPKKDEPKKDEPKKDEKKPEPKKPDKQPQPSEPPKSPKQREMESMLDSLERDEKNLQKERMKARVVRGRERRPAKDW